MPVTDQLLAPQPRLAWESVTAALALPQSTASPFSEATQIRPFLKVAPKLEAHILVSENMTCFLGM